MVLSCFVFYVFGDFIYVCTLNVSVKPQLKTFPGAGVKFGNKAKTWGEWLKTEPAGDPRAEPACSAMPGPRGGADPKASPSPFLGASPR